MLTASGICKSRNGRILLSDISITLRSGSLVALMGPSGSGKSTFLRILAAIDKPDRGTITIDGKAVYAMSRGFTKEDVWPTICMVFQDIILWPHLTAMENILVALRSKRLKEELSFISELMERLEVDHLRDRYPVRMSRGEQQRVAIVRALAVRPRYLLLDEATASLDINHATAVAQMLKGCASEGLAILAATHQEEFANELGPDRMRLLDGRLVMEDLLPR